MTIPVEISWNNSFGRSPIDGYVLAFLVVLVVVVVVVEFECELELLFMEIPCNGPPYLFPAIFPVNSMGVR